MNRARFVVAASIAGATLLGASVVAQQAPPMQSVLAGKKFTPPIKGLAEVQYVKSYGPKVEKGMVVTEFKVKNISNAPIPRLTIAETWYDGKGGIVTGGKGFINGLLQPGEIGTIRVESPYNTAAKQNMLNFSHANGEVKPKLVKSFDEPDKQPSAKNASTAKKPAPAKKK